MSANHMHDAPQNSWDDEQLLEWILNRDAVAAPANETRRSDPAVRARMEELTGFLSECRSALRHEQALEDGRAEAQEREAELTERVLARTTREDLSWRGDLTLVGGFLRDRLSRSVVLRFAAASLLLHMAALPVLAYYAFLAPTPPFININVIEYEEQHPAQPFPDEKAVPEIPVEVDLDEEPAVREQDGGSEKER